MVSAVVDWKGQIVTMADRAYLTEAMPMAVIWGRDDRVIPVRHASNAAALAPHARVEVIPDAGHFPHKDHPQRFAKIVHEFIRSTEPATYSRARFRGLLKTGRAAPVSPVAVGRESAPRIAGVRPASPSWRRRHAERVPAGSRAPARSRRVAGRRAWRRARSRSASASTSSAARSRWNCLLPCSFGQRGGW